MRKENLCNASGGFYEYLLGFKIVEAKSLNTGHALNGVHIFLNIIPLSMMVPLLPYDTIKSIIHIISFISVLYHSYPYYIIHIHIISFISILYHSYPYYIIHIHIISFISILYHSYPYYIIHIHIISFISISYHSYPYYIIHIHIISFIPILYNSYPYYIMYFIPYE